MNKSQEAMYGAGKTLQERLIYAASARCTCGYGFAYDKGGKVFTESGSPFVIRPDQWECSGILLHKAGELPSTEFERLKERLHQRPISFASGIDIKPERHGQTTSEPIA